MTEKFNKGDVVRIESYLSYREEWEGLEGVVSEVLLDPYGTIFTPFNNRPDGMGRKPVYWPADGLELVRKAAPMLKVGDRVRLTGGKLSFLDEWAGLEAVVLYPHKETGETATYLQPVSERPDGKERMRFNWPTVELELIDKEEPVMAGISITNEVFTKIVNTGVNTEVLDKVFQLMGLEVVVETTVTVPFSENKSYQNGL